MLMAKCGVVHGKGLGVTEACIIVAGSRQRDYSFPQENRKC